MATNPIQGNTKSQGSISNPFKSVWIDVASKVSGIVAAGAPIFGYNGAAASQIATGIFIGKAMTHLASLKTPRWEDIPALLVNEMANLITLASTAGKYMGRFNPQYIPHWNLIQATADLYHKGNALISAASALQKARNPEQQKVAYTQLLSAVSSLGSSLAKCAIAYYAAPLESAKFALYVIAQTSALYTLYLTQTNAPLMHRDEEVELISFAPPSEETATQEVSSETDIPITSEPASFSSPNVWRGPIQ
ncbi:MAG: hypothetical protein HYZ47_03250 [Simkania negevensis]|nr:hypothetical protein [Simkania negevensis]